MSISNTMFNERDRRCTAVQPMLSTNQSYDNRTISGTPKMQILIATNNRDVPRVMKTKFPDTVMVFGVVSSEATSCHLTSSKSAWKSTPKCTWMCWRVGDPWSNQVAGGRPWVWQQDSAPAHKSKETQAWFQEGVLWLCTLLSLAPSSSVWSYVENITSRTSHNTKASLFAAICWVFAELPPALVEKACSQFRIRIVAVIEAEGGYIEYMSALLHKQVIWIDFFNKSF